MHLAMVNDVMAKQHKCNTMSVRKVDLVRVSTERINLTRNMINNMKSVI